MTKSPGTHERPITEFSGPSHSYVWKGGALHLRVPGGDATIPEPHSHFAIQLSLSTVGILEFRPSRSSCAGQAAAWLVGSDEPHWMVCDHPTVTLFWSPVTSDGRRCAARLKNRPATPLTPEEAENMRRRLEQIWASGWGLPALCSLAHEFAIILSPAPDLATIDSRVQRVLDQLAGDPSDKSGLGELAASVGLSESRLAHLFRNQVGMPVRQYRLTLRLEHAICAIDRGRSLTEAAHDAGFSDSAHFSRTSRRMFGLAPSKLPAFTTSSRSSGSVGDID